MTDKLSELLSYFELRARIFQSGPLCHSSNYDMKDGLGYIHVQQSGVLEVESPRHPTLRIDEPSLIFYMNPLTHRLRPIDAKVSMLCASFEFGHAIKTPLLNALPNVIYLKLKQLPNLQQMLNILFKEASKNNSGRQILLDRMIEVVIIQLLRDLMETQQTKIGLLAGLADAKLSKAFQAIHSHPAHPWNLAQLASKSGMSRARFAARFHQVVGMTPGNYLVAWRLGMAQALLQKGKPLSYIADQVGYANSSALSRAFRSQLNESPKSWLKKYNCDA